MFKRIVVILAFAALIGFYGINMAAAQEDEGMGVKGVVTEVAEDGSFLVINDETLMIDPELQDYMNIESGDSVELIVKTVDGKKVVMDFDYIDLE